MGIQSHTLERDSRWQASCHSRPWAGSQRGTCGLLSSGWERTRTTSDSSALLWTTRWLLAWARSASHPAKASRGKVGGGTGRFTSGLSGNHPIPAPSHLPEGDLAELEEGWTGSLWLGTLAPLKARLWLPSRVSLREAPDGTRLGVSGVSRMLVGMEKGLGGQGCVLTLHTLELSSKTSPKLQTLGDGKGDSQRRLHSPGTRCLT